MTTSPTIDVAVIRPLEHAEGIALFAAELDQNVNQWASLDADDWTRATDCPDWDVRLMALHVLGACESGASNRELVHQMLAARRYQKKHGGPQEAALSAVQVAERINLTPAQLIDQMRAVAPKTVRKRLRMPSLMRRFSMKVDGPVVEKWTLGYLIDVIYLRDAWMHRVDIARATGRDLVLTPEHDGRIVADVVGEWAHRHGQSFRLTLTGPAGGEFAAGSDGPVLREDAVEFCRILAGRAPGEGLLTTIVPF